jgi:molybdopterin molybdotransferase
LQRQKTSLRLGKKGEQLFSPGTRLTMRIALAAAVGRSRLVVHARPRVAVLSTGDEVIDIDLPPGPSQIRNSNSFAGRADTGLWRRAGVAAIAPDEWACHQELVEEGLECDLPDCGRCFHGEIRPGRAGTRDLKADFFHRSAYSRKADCVRASGACASAEKARYFFLPGNPISTMVTFGYFAKPIVEALAGMTARPVIFTHAKLKSAIQRKTGSAVLAGAAVREFEQSQGS